MINPFNPFNTPAPAPANPFAPPAGVSPFGATTNPEVWATPGAVHVPPVVVPTGTAIDQDTGEVFYKELADGTKVPYDRDQMLLDWQHAQQQLDFWKAQEMDLRGKVVASFTDPDKKKGTENVALGAGWQLKVKKGLRYTLKSFDAAVSMHDAVSDAIKKMCSATHDRQGNPLDPNRGREFASTLVKWSADLSVSTYDMLDPGYKEIIDTVLEMKSAAPTVEINPPKEPK